MISLSQTYAAAMASTPEPHPISAMRSGRQPSAPTPTSNAEPATASVAEVKVAEVNVAEVKVTVAEDESPLTSEEIRLKESLAAAQSR